jgi:ZU5 domain
VTRITNPSYRFAFRATHLAVLVLAVSAACGGGGGDPQPIQDMQATIGPQGGELAGAKGSALEGVKLVVPAGALASDTRIEIKAASSDVALPAGVAVVGKQFEISPAGMQLAVPAQLTLPVDASQVDANFRSAQDVIVLVQDGGEWARREQIDGGDGNVTVEISSLAIAEAGVNPPKPDDVVRFDLHPNPKFLNCFSRFPGDANRAPSVQATIVRGDLNDELTLRGQNFKPGLKFDVFTVQRSTLDATGKVDPTVPNFGFAWYQSELEARDNGDVRVKIQTILLDEIFGFDPIAGLGPTNTFHLGFWFDDPQQAAACGFDPTQPTPFNGEHQAGPLAMISVPDATTGLGPLCTKPDTSTVPAHCNP